MSDLPAPHDRARHPLVTHSWSGGIKVFIQSGIKEPPEPLNDILTNIKVSDKLRPIHGSSTRHRYAAHELDDRTAEISGRVLASSDSRIPVASGQSLQRREPVLRLADRRG